MDESFDFSGFSCQFKLQTMRALEKFSPFPESSQLLLSCLRAHRVELELDDKLGRFSSDWEEPAIVSTREQTERLLTAVIQEIESKIITQKKFLSISLTSLDAFHIPFLPESRTLKRSPIRCHRIARTFGMADLIALDRSFKRIEEDDTFSASMTLWFMPTLVNRLDCNISDLYQTDNRWHLERYIESISEGVSSSELEDAFTVVVAAVLHLLSFVFQYLIGYVDRGGSKTYSSGSFDFRATFVSLVLFQGAYVWIKFRQAARPACRKRKAFDTLAEGSIYRRAYKDAISDTIRHYRYEPRFTPPREEADEETSRLPLGGYATHGEANFVLQVARFYYMPYGKDGGCVELENGLFKFIIPPMSEQGLVGEGKRTWVANKAKELGTQMYADFQKEMEKAKQLGMASEIGGHGHDAGSSDPSPSLLLVTCSSPTTIAREPVIVTEAPSCPNSSSLPPCDGTVGGSFDTLSDFDYVIDELFGPGLPNLPPLQSSLVPYEMHSQGFAQILGDSSTPRGEGVTRGIEHGEETQLSPSLNLQQGSDAVTENIDAPIFSLFRQKSDSVLQQMVDSQMKEIMNLHSRIVVFDHRLKLSEIEKSELREEVQRLRDEKQQEKEPFEQEKECLRQENERMKKKLEQVENERLQENELLKSTLEQVAKRFSYRGIEKS